MCKIQVTYRDPAFRGLNTEYQFMSATSAVKHFTEIVQSMNGLNREIHIESYEDRVEVQVKAYDGPYNACITLWV